MNIEDNAHRLELVIYDGNKKISKTFKDGNDMYYWAQKMKPSWKFEEHQSNNKSKKEE